MGRLLIAALAACFLVTARADEKPPGGPGEKAAAGTVERKAARAGRTDRRAPSPKALPGGAAPGKQKPCEVVRPCPID